MRVALGGTFNCLHRGHRTLIDKAVSIGDNLSIGITSDGLASNSRADVVPLNERRARLIEYLALKGVEHSIVVIDDSIGPAATDPDLDVMVVSPETLTGAKLINKARKDNELAELRLVVVPYVLADDGLPLSSGRVSLGEIDDKGRLLRDVVIAVGSCNPVKVEAVRNVMGRIFKSVTLIPMDVDHRTPEQPIDDQTRAGALNRARSCRGDHDLAVGIEAGVFRLDDGLYDVQHCAVIDRGGRVTTGMGPGFRYPPLVDDLVGKGVTVGEAFRTIAGEEGMDRSEGAIGYLSKGILDRQGLTEMALIAAMVPRIRPELYW